MKKYLLISVIVVIFYSIWLVGVPRLAGFVKPYLLSAIEQKIGYTVDENNLYIKTSIMPYIYLCADEIEIRNPFDTPIIQTGALNLKLSLLPFLLGKIHVKSVKVDKCRADIYLDEKIFKDKKSLQFLKKITFDSNLITIKNYIIKFAQKQNADGYKISGKNFYFSNSRNIKNIKFNAQISADNHTSFIDADIYIPKEINKKVPYTRLSIKDFCITPVYKYFYHYLPNDIVSMQGMVNIDAKDGNYNTVFDSIKIAYKNEYKSIIFPKRLVSSGKYVLTENSIDISSAKLKSESISIDGGFKINNYKSKHPDINMEAAVSDTRSDTLIKMLPPLNTPDINLFYMKKYPLYADINGYLSFTGKLPEPDIIGNILVNNGYLIKPIPNDKIKASIKLIFKNKAVFYNILAGAGGGEKVTVAGDTKLYGDKYSNMKIKSTQNINLATAKSIVDPLHQILYFETGPVPIMGINGIGNIDIKVEGNHKNPHVWGRMNFKNAEAEFNDIKGIVFKRLDGVIEFKNQSAEFKLLRGFIDNNPINLYGVCDLFGNLKVNADTKNLNLERAVNVIKSSPMLKDIKRLLPPIEKLSGKTDLNLVISGTVPDVNNIIFNKNIFVNGSLKLKDVTAGVKDIAVSKLNGDIIFKGTDIELDVKSKLNQSVISLSGTIKNNIADIKAFSNKLNLKYILGSSLFKGLSDDNYISFNASYKGRADKIEYNKIKLTAKAAQSNPNAPVVFTTGNITVKNGTCIVDNVKGTITKNPFVLNTKVTNIGKKNQNINGTIKLNNANLSTINFIREFYLVPEETKELFRKLDFKTGKTNINFEIINNHPFTKILLDNVEITYLPLNMPLKIINGSVELRKDKVFLNKINALADDMPVFIEGNIGNIYKSPLFDIYINSVPKQSFIDKYINKNTMYPLKIKGDIIYSANIKGYLNNYNIAANAKIGEKSSVYYLGATIGDGENQTIIDFDGNIIQNNSIRINNFTYNKSVLSQNNRSNIVNFLKIKGSVKFNNNEPYFNNFVIKTENPTDARIFNIIFKKPNIKQGLFTSDLKINGRLYDLKIVGDFHIFDIDVPLLQTIVKDISLNFLPKSIRLKSKSEIFSNEINFDVEADNSLKPPFRIRSGNIHFNKLDLNAAISDLKKFEINKPKQESVQNNKSLNISDFIIEKLDLTAKDVLIKGVSAKNLKTVISLTDKMLLALNDYSADIASGKLSGDFSYNFFTGKTSLLVNAEEMDANNLSEMLFDLSNQMYGALTGTLNITCNGTNAQICMSTLTGNGTFNVSDGRMPKLGSLEYLLKAGNLLKGGLTDLSINSIIDIITPLKTGEFTDIFGSIKILNGIAEDIKISTKGENLSLYMKGNYNLVTSDAQMYVFGLLSKKIKTPLGAIGNMSLNTLFNLIPGVKLEQDSPFISDINKIPGIELSKDDYRKFIAEIRGDINGENYVKSFKWID